MNHLAAQVSSVAWILRAAPEVRQRISALSQQFSSLCGVFAGEARQQGVKRGMRGSDARKLCPTLQLVQVPTSNGKADLTSYRRHGNAVLEILSEPDGDVGVHYSWPFGMRSLL